MKRKTAIAVTLILLVFLIACSYFYKSEIVFEINKNMQFLADGNGNESDTWVLIKETSGIRDNCGSAENCGCYNPKWEQNITQGCYWQCFKHGGWKWGKDAWHKFYFRTINGTAYIKIKGTGLRSVGGKGGKAIGEFEAKYKDGLNILLLRNRYHGNSDIYLRADNGRFYLFKYASAEHKKDDGRPRWWGDVFCHIGRGEGVPGTYCFYELTADNDGDGYWPPEDCDDTNPDIHPDADEICDGLDNNCNGETDEEPYASQSCDDSVSCTDDACIAGACQNNANDSLCDNGLWCDGTETCDSLLDCQAGTPVNCSDAEFCTVNERCDEELDECVSDARDCSGNNLPGIATCDNDPDANPFTWDFFAGFNSVCDENADECTTGNSSITHTCDIAQCGAECENADDCEDTECDQLDGCAGDDYYDYNDAPNDCIGCVCEDNECNDVTIYENDSRCITTTTINESTTTTINESTTTTINESTTTTINESTTTTINESTTTTIEEECNENSDCDDELWCNGQEQCIEGMCQAGTPVNCSDAEFCTVNERCDEELDECVSDARDCSGNNLPGIATCDNDPDANPFTWDFFAGFNSVCDENADECTTGNSSITHTCDIAQCGAECESADDCPEKCTQISHKLYTNIECNACECDYSSYQCVVGKCGAECDEDQDCACAEDYCDGTTLVDYPEYGRCGTAGAEGCLCQIDTGQGGDCEPVLIPEHPDCTEQNGPIFGLGENKTYYPSVVKTNESYKMWYGTSGSRTALAVSDDGLEWHDRGVVMPNGYHARVIYNENGFGNGIYYKMWYWNSSELYSINVIRYTESTNGVNWTNDQAITQIGNTVIDNTGNNWNKGSYGPIDIIYNADGSNGFNDTDIWSNKYVMYYDGTTGSFEEVGLAYSADGLEWKGYGRVMQRGNDGAWGNTDDWDSSYTSFGSVFRICNNWIFYYSGGTKAVHEGIGIAYSADGLSWERDDDNPLLHINDGIDYRNKRTYAPSIIVENQKIRMWYACKGNATAYSGNESDYAICYEEYAVPISLCSENITAEPDFNKAEYLHLRVNDPYMVLYMPFDIDTGNKTYDYTDNNNDATVRRNTKHTENGYIGSAYEFDGIDDYLFVENNPSIDFDSNFTISAWVYSKGSDDIQTIVAKGSPREINGTGFEFYWGTDNRIYFTLNNGSSTKKEIYSSVLELNKWYHVTAVAKYNENNWSGSSLYINATEDAKNNSLAWKYGSISTFRNLMIGRYTTTFNGTIDELMMWNKALTGTEINEIYNNQSARFHARGEYYLDEYEFAQDSTKNRINVSLSGQTLMNSRFSAMLWEWNSTQNNWMYNSEQETAMSGDGNYLAVFNISNTTSRILSAVVFYTDSNEFYSPVLSDAELTADSGVSGTDMDTSSSTTSITTTTVNSGSGGSGSGGGSGGSGSGSDINATTTTTGTAGSTAGSKESNSSASNESNQSKKTSASTNKSYDAPSASILTGAFADMFGLNEEQALWGAGLIALIAVLLIIYLIIKLKSRKKKIFNNP